MTSKPKNTRKTVSSNWRWSRLRRSSRRSNDKNRRPGAIVRAVCNVVGTGLGGAFAVMIAAIIVSDQRFEGQSNVTIDSTTSFRGDKCVQWSFRVQPETRYIHLPFVLQREVGCFAHMETVVDSNGSICDLDLSEYDGIKLFLKSTNQRLVITEFNLFCTDDYIQYVWQGDRPIIATTKFNQYRFDFGSMRPSEKQLARVDRVDKQIDIPLLPDLSKVTAFGLDIKTTKDLLYEKVWIDHVTAYKVGDRKETLICACEDMRSAFRGVPLRWASDWRKYHHP